MPFQSFFQDENDESQENKEILDLMKRVEKETKFKSKGKDLPDVITEVQVQNNMCFLIDYLLKFVNSDESVSTCTIFIY